MSLRADNSFPSISRYKRSQTRADKQDGNSNDDPIFSPTHFHSFKWPIPRVLSALIMMALTRIYAPSLFLCLFILAHCLDPHHGDNKTDIDQSVLACSHTFNDHSSTLHSPSRKEMCIQIYMFLDVHVFCQVESVARPTKPSRDCENHIYFGCVVTSYWSILGCGNHIYFGAFWIVGITSILGEW